MDDARVEARMRQAELQRSLEEFRRLDDVSGRSQDDPVRISEQPKLVSSYYDAVTAFYEFAWGKAFHFSPRRPGESLRRSQRLQEEEVARRLGLKAGMEVADIGCGVGGPLITIARATGARITGINFNAHQIRRGERHVRRAGLGDSCRFLHADFMNVPLDDGAFDAIYAFESLCHAPNKRLAFRELFRLLKPGGRAAIVDWCLTDEFDGANAQHDGLRARIEKGNAVTELMTTKEQLDAMQRAGFKVTNAFDQQAEFGNPATPWYMALQGRDLSLSSLARIPAGRAATERLTRWLERLRIVPAGTSEAAQLLNVAADALVEAGELGIFTPSFVIHARKPA